MCPFVDTEDNRLRTKSGGKQNGDDGGPHAGSPGAIVSSHPPPDQPSCRNAGTERTMTFWAVRPQPQRRRREDRDLARLLAARHRRHGEAILGYMPPATMRSSQRRRWRQDGGHDDAIAEVEIVPG